jgi:putative FmdB family regulatory protein
MPIFEFKCPKCGKYLERVLSIAIAPFKCPVCGELMEKLISAPAIHFKGDGWTRKGGGNE